MPKGNIVLILIVSASFIAYAGATINHPSPKSDLKKRQPTNPVPPPKAYVARSSDKELSHYLDAHNALRQKVGVAPLAWDGNLAASAHTWAVQRQGDCKYRVHSTNKYGENIFWMSYKEFSPYDVVGKWFDEHRFYDQAKKACMCMPERAGCECGHYLNVIWSSTKRVGCSGAVYCDNQKGVLVVCQYDPAGLEPGTDPFTGTKTTSGGKGGKTSTNADHSKVANATIHT